MDEELDETLTSKADQHLYAIIDEYGTCWVIQDGGTEKVRGLPWLMRQGWRPVRETPFVPNSGSDYILIYFERERLQPRT
jgi:hypothetical protein